MTTPSGLQVVESHDTDTNINRRGVADRPHLEACVNLGATDVEPQQLVNTLRDSAWQTLLALGLTAASAMLGGIVGARDDLRWGRSS